MSISHTVEVFTFSSREPIAVQLNDSCTAGRAKVEIWKKLGLQSNTMDLFGLFLGPLGQPTRLLLETDVIPAGSKLSLERWNFDVDREMKLVRKDDVAISLLYNEAVYYLEKGKIHATESQLEELESFSDPSFPTERQYLELISTIPGYTAYNADDCKVLEDIVSNDVQIPRGTVVQCVLDMHCLALKGDIHKSESLIEWSWTSVRRWRIPSPGEIKFEVCLQKGNAPMMCWVTFSTPMAQVIFQTASGICQEVKRLQDKAAVPVAAANPRTAGKHYDPLHELVDNILFKAPKFSSI